MSVSEFTTRTLDTCIVAHVAMIITVQSQIDAAMCNLSWRSQSQTKLTFLSIALQILLEPFPSLQILFIWLQCAQL